MFSHDLFARAIIDDHHSLQVLLAQTHELILGSDHGSRNATELLFPLSLLLFPVLPDPVFPAKFDGVSRGVGGLPAELDGAAVLVVVEQVPPPLRLHIYLSFFTVNVCL